MENNNVEIIDDMLDGVEKMIEEDLLENLVYFVNSISKIKPSTVKGDYIKNISVSTTMGPGVKVSINSFDK